MDASGGLDTIHVTGLIAALVLGSIIGLERQFRKHPAGLHTTALVALGSAAFAIAGVLLATPRGRRASSGKS